MNMNLGKLQEMVRDRRPRQLQCMVLQRVRHNWYNNDKESFRIQGFTFSVPDLEIDLILSMVVLLIATSL